MLVYAYLNGKEFNDLVNKNTNIQSQTQEVENIKSSKKRERVIVCSDKIEGFLSLSQILSGFSDGFEDGGYLCSFDIPNENLVSGGELQALDASDESVSLKVFYVPIEKLSNDWLKQSVCDLNAELSEKTARNIFCQKGKEYQV